MVLEDEKKVHPHWELELRVENSLLTKLVNNSLKFGLK